MRWRIDLEYDGAAFVGWQFQPGQRSIQGVVQEAIRSLVGHEVVVRAAGRTDAGVHARQQVACFDTDVNREEVEVLRGLNAYLPADVAVVRAQAVPDDFDPRGWVVRKTYRYRWLQRPSRSPLRANRVWHVRGPLDADRMDRAAQLLVGRHDFSAFRAAGCSASHAVRTVEAAEVHAVEDELRLAVTGNGFLRHMVRIIAGTLTDVGRGRDPSWVTDVLESQDRSRAGKTAPPEGLVLYAVEVGDGPRPERT